MEKYLLIYWLVRESGMPLGEARDVEVVAPVGQGLAKCESVRNDILDADPHFRGKCILVP